jgi:O-antigen ligase
VRQRRAEPAGPLAAVDRLAALIAAAAWRPLLVITGAAVAIGTVAGMLGIYRVAFVVGLLPFALAAYRNLAAGSVLIALSSPVVALGSISAGFHVLPCYVFVLASLAGLLVRRELRHFEPRPWDWLLLAFLLVAATVSVANLGAVPHSTVIGAGGVNGPDVRSIAQLAAIAMMGALYLVLRTALRAPGRVEALARALVVATGFVAAYALYQAIGRQLGLPYVYVNARRSLSSLPNGNDYFRVNSTLTEAAPLAQFMLIGLLLGLAWLRGGEARPAWMTARTAAALCVAAAVIMGATLSIAAWVACSLLAPLVLALSARRWRWRIGLGAVATLLVVVLVVVPHFRSNMGVAANAGGDVVRAQRYVREGYWIAALESVRHHPLGVGVGNFPFYYPLYAPLDPRYEYQVGLADAHNLFLDVAAETGVAGFALFAAFFLALLYAGFRSVLAGARARARSDPLPNIGLAATAALAGGLLMQLTYSYAYYPFVWVLAAIVGSLPLVLRLSR